MRRGDSKHPRCPVHGAVLCCSQEHRGHWFCYPCATQEDDAWPQSIYDQMDPASIRATGCCVEALSWLRRIGLAFRVLKQ